VFILEPNISRYRRWYVALVDDWGAQRRWQ
jgi:hypothetical protein